MNLISLAWFAAGSFFGVAVGLVLKGVEREARNRQIRAVVAAYEAEIARIKGLVRG